MPVNAINDNDLEQIKALYDIRSEMQSFCQNEDNRFARFGVLSAYEKLIDDDLRSKINAVIQEYVYQRLNAGEFNYFQFKTTSEKEDKARRSGTNKSKAQNSNIALVRKQIKEEIAFQATVKEELKGRENAEILSVSVDKDYFTVKLSDSDEPLKLRHCTHQKGKKHFSLFGRAAILNTNIKPGGINNKAYELIAACGEDGFVLQDMEKPVDSGKKYSPAEYRILSGMPRSAELSAHQKKELEFLNKLSLSDQKSFVIALKKRTILLKKHKEITDFVANVEDKTALLINPEKLQAMLKANDLDDFTGTMQKQFIHTIQKNKEIWSNFSKNDEENTNRFSRYEVLQNNIISRNSDLFAEVYNANFDDEKDVHKKLADCFTKVRHLSEAALPDGLCAEIIASGIFKEAMRTGVDEEKLSKMNMLLNEFNLNIEFKPLPVTQIPADEIANAAEQSKIDRLNFEQLKRSETYLNEEQKFASELKKHSTGKPNHTSTHHYIALKYNAFVEPELNDNSLLVKTARVNAWNYDGHATSHLFDTAGEFLIVNEENKYSFSDFNTLRNRFKNGEKMQIMAPILQIAKEDGKFKDLLALGENGASGQYVSDNTTARIIKVPEYCQIDTIPPLVLKKNKEKAAQKA